MILLNENKIFTINKVDNYNVYNRNHRHSNDFESDAEHVSLMMNDHRSQRQAVG